MMILIALFFLGGVQTPADPIAEHLARYRKAAGADSRCAELVAIAGLIKSSQALSSEAIAGALINGLGDELLRVKATAIELLADNSALDITLPALLQAAKAYSKREAEFEKKMNALNAGWLTARLAKRCGADKTIENEIQADLDRQRANWVVLRQISLSFAASDDPKERARKKKAAEEFDRQLANIDELKRMVQTVSDNPLVTSALASAFGKLRDDRSIEGLDLIVQCGEGGSCADLAIDSLLAFGTSRALERLVDELDRFGDYRAKRDEATQSLRSQKPGKKPEGWADSVWEKSEHDRIAKLVEVFNARAQAEDAWIDALCAKLRSFASAHGLSGPPPSSIPVEPWRRWSARARENLSASLQPSSK